MKDKTLDKIFEKIDEIVSSKLEYIKGHPIKTLLIMFIIGKFYKWLKN